MTVDREQVRRDEERTIRLMLKQAEYFDSADGADLYVEAIAALDVLLAELEQAELALSEALSLHKSALRRNAQDREALEQAKRDNETLSEANGALRRSAIANRDCRKRAEARLAKVPALVEAASALLAFQVPDEADDSELSRLELGLREALAGCESETESRAAEREDTQASKG